MTSIIPITLKGDNLGQRHKYLNNLVKEAIENNTDFNCIKESVEHSPIDRLFKIKLANEIKNVEYIIHNLKHDDMLYVSYALKAKWLINHQDIINPDYLENNLYPEMISTAITKVKHWLYINLKENIRCKIFYEYYKDIDFDYSMKFFVNTSESNILVEFPKIIQKITPSYFKLLCEKCPKTAKIFFDLIESNSLIKNQYCFNEKEYFNSLKYIPNTEPDLYLNLIEKYQNIECAYNRSPNTTRYILKKCKKRFMEKPELYTYCILDTKTLAQMLTVEEIKSLVIKLARAKFLKNWFSYKQVEPFIKRLGAKERAAFKKKIFVDRDVGAEIDKWPYEIPKPPQPEEKIPNIFKDKQKEPSSYENLGKPKRLIMKKSMKYSAYEVYSECINMDERKTKTQLDKLFDEFRFCSFEKTLFELRKRIQAESSVQNREFMILVLVSKSGGRFDALFSMMELLKGHINEPANVRATVIRSLVKRAFIWRVPGDIWTYVLEFGHGLGLDGKDAEADCIEGFHASVLRNLLHNSYFEPFVLKKFLSEFTDFTEFSLVSAEKKIIGINLCEMLLTAVNESDSVAESLDLIYKLWNTLSAYKIINQNLPQLLDIVQKLAEKDLEQCSAFLRILYDAKIGRKQLLKYTFNIIQSDASYVNALKHDPSIIDFKKMIEQIKETNEIDENNGLAKQCLKQLKVEEHNKVLGRVLAMLIGKEFNTFLENVDTCDTMSSKLLSSRLRATAHLVRPAWDINNYDWSKLGAKFFRNKYKTCRKVEMQHIVQKLLNWKPTIKLAFELSMKLNITLVSLTVIANKKPTYAIMSGLKVMKEGNEKYNTIWNIIRPLIEKLDWSKPDKIHLLNRLKIVDNLPSTIKPDYCVVMYKICKKIKYFLAMPYLCHIEILIQNVDETFIKEVLLEFLNDFTVSNVFDKCNNITKHNSNCGFDYIRCYMIHVRILAKYILLCKTDEVQRERLQTFAQPFLEKIKLLLDSENTKTFTKDNFLNEFLKKLKYTDCFLTADYVSCIPVTKFIAQNLLDMLQLEKDFEEFVFIHLTMLYYKTLKQGIKNYPDIFSDKDKKIKEGTNIVGYIFGKYIAKEVNMLAKTYFDSVIELYREHLKSYMRSYFDAINGTFIAEIIKGILDGSEGSEQRLGIYILKDNSYEINKEFYSEILDVVRRKEDVQAKFFAHAELF